MDEKEFWRIIALFNWKRTGDDGAVLKPAIKEPAKHSVEEISAFEEILTQKLYGLETVAHAKNIDEDSYVDDSKHFSVDLFLYARCCVVANGKAFYERVLSDPTQFPHDMELEALLGLADAAYAAKTGNQNEGFQTSVSYETFSNRAGWSA